VTPHATHVVSDPHDASATRFRPHCTCGWVGGNYTSRELAETRATLHRRNAALAEIMP
jgi:hypothetical protein